MNKKDKSIYNKKYLKQYFRSFHGVAKRLYHHMKERSKINNWNFSLSYNDFVEWLDKSDYEKIYDNWVRKNYNNKLKPSIDRINDYGIYEIGNIRVITWKENWLRGQKSNKNIVAYTKNFSIARKKRQYKFIVIDDDDNIISISNNQLKLSKDLNLNVSHVNACLLNKRPRHKNLYFHVVEVVK